MSKNNIKQLKKSPYYQTQNRRAKSLNIKEWAIKKIKEGVSPNKIARDIGRLFGEYVSMQTIYRWRYRYIAVTGEALPAWIDLNKTPAQKKKNQALKWKTKEVRK